MFPQTNSRAFIRAYKKGLLAGSCGLSKRDNPYPDKRTKMGRVTFSRAFRRFWEKGCTDSSPRGLRLFGKKALRGLGRVKKQVKPRLKP